MTALQQPVASVIPSPARQSSRLPPLDTSTRYTGGERTPSPNARKQPLPSPIGIPARPRSNTGSSCRPSVLSSSPTETPFSLPPENSFRLSPPRSAVIYEERASSISSSSSKASPVRSRSTPPIPTAHTRASPKATTAVEDDFGDLMVTGMHLATSSCAAEALLATGSLSALPSRPPTKRRSSSGTKKGWTHKLFGGDSLLGSSEPPRAAPVVREPIPTVVFGADEEISVEVCRTLINSKNYTLVALVVNIDTPVTTELRSKGVKVIQVDMDNPATYERHLAGAKAVYLSTNVLTLHSILQHQPEPKRTEIARAADRNQITKALNACSRANVGHVVFRVNACGHEVIENVLGKGHVLIGGYKTKSNSSAELDRLAVPHTVLHTSVPFNRIDTWLEDKGDGFVVNLPVPDETQIPWFSSEQTGEYVLAALENPKRWLGADMHAISEVMTPPALASRLTKLARRPVSTAHVTREEFASLETHERLACKWDAWAQLVRGEYDFENTARPTLADVPDQWCFDAWYEHDTILCKRFDKLR